ncbi:MAG: holo-[acyl-carrier-protein] synthase, partial [Verrucomicrobiota bacterium]
AFGTGIGEGVGWLDIEVGRKPSGEPFILLHNGAAALAGKLGIETVMLSLSHSDHYAIANAIAIGPEGSLPGPAGSV